MIATEGESAGSPLIKPALNEWGVKLIALAYREYRIRHAFWGLTFSSVSNTEVYLTSTALSRCLDSDIFCEFRSRG